MDTKLQKEFEDYLNSINSNKTLKIYALRFFADLSEYFNNQTFNASDFETIKINGETVKQDVVNDLISKRGNVKAEEVFLYLFKKNVNTLKFYIGKPNLIESTVGFYDSSKKMIAVKYLSILRFFQDVKLDKDYEKTTIKEKMKKAREFREDEIIRTFYHEMCHVFEVKTFFDRRIIKIDMSSNIFAFNNGEFAFNCRNNNIIGKKNIETGEFIFLDIANKSQNSNNRVFNILEYQGEDACSEIFNEIFALKVAKKFCEYPNEHYTNISNTFLKKCDILSNSAYKSNDYIVEFLNMTSQYFSDKRQRFNYNDFKNVIESLNISDEEKVAIKYKFLGVIKRANLSQKTIADIENSIDSESFYTIFMSIIGLADLIEKNKVSSITAQCEDFKIIVQQILLYSIKNDVKGMLSNPKLKKDESFFKGIEFILQGIDSFILWPTFSARNGELSLEAHNSITSEVTNKSIKNLSDNHPEFEHVKLFAEIITMTQNALEDYNRINPNNKINLKFLDTQDYKTYVSDFLEYSALELVDLVKPKTKILKKKHEPQAVTQNE